MPIQLKSPWITFWPLWVLANVVSFYSVSGLFAVPDIITAFSAGILLAVLRWLVLQRYVGVDYTWFVAGTVVYGVFLMITMRWAIISVFRFPVTCVVCLGLLGLLQRGALKPYVDSAGLWPVASPGAAIVAYAFVLMLRPGAGSTLATFWLIFGIIYGAVTGAIIIWLKESTKRYVDDSVPSWKRA